MDTKALASLMRETAAREAERAIAKASEGNISAAAALQAAQAEIASLRRDLDQLRETSARAVSLDEIRILCDAAATLAVKGLPKAENGKSVDEEAIRGWIKAASLEAVAVDLGSTKTDIVKAVLAALPEPKVGEPGKSVSLDEVRLLCDAAVAIAVRALPKPEKGEDGKSVSMAELVDKIADGIKHGVEHVRPQIVESVLKAIPAPATSDEIRAMVKAAVAEIVLPLPPTADEVAQRVLRSIEKPKDGNDGPTTSEIEAMVRAAIQAMPLPKNGTSVTLDDVRPFMEAGMAVWALDFERRGVDLLQRLADRMPRPEPGKDGDPGASLDDFLVEQTGDRTATVTAVVGGQKRSFELSFPVPLDKGIWKQGAQYERGDAVTFGGSLFIAQADTDATPEKSSDWRLAVKRGRDRE